MSKDCLTYSNAVRTPPLLTRGAGFFIMVPIAVCRGELFTFGDKPEGFISREDLHSFRYISFNVFAGTVYFSPLYSTVQDDALNRLTLGTVSAASGKIYTPEYDQWSILKNKRPTTVTSPTSQMY